MIRLVVLFGLVAPSFCQVPTSCAEVTCQPPLICDVQPLQCINPPCGDIATCVDPDAAACAAISCMRGVPCRVINGRAQCVPNKPGACPVLPPGTVGLCVERCTGDHSCPNDQKCCSNGCGHDCMAPAPTSCAAVTCRQGTICIVKDGQAQCIDPDQPYCEYGEPLPNIFCGRGPSRQDCPSGYSCHVHPTDRFAVCCQVEKTGTCPAVPPGTVGICVEECSRDNDCQNDRKCCSNACGHVCKDPVTSPTCETTKCRKNEICEMVPAPCLIPPCPEFPRCRDPCANVRCEENEICELVQVQCIRAPCPPQPQCRNLCATVDCRDGYQCQVRNGQAVCVRTPPTVRCPDGSSPPSRCRSGYCGRFHYCFQAEGDAVCCPRGRRQGWWWSRRS